MAEPRIAGLTRAEWVHCGQVIMRWPRLNACNPDVCQWLIGTVNANIALLDQEEGDIEGGAPPDLGNHGSTKKGELSPPTTKGNRA